MFNTFKIAQVASWLTHTSGHLFGSDELETLFHSVKEALEPAKPNTMTVDTLLCAMKDGRKIDAIKEYRILTGAGLKESKDAVEKYWIGATA